VAGISFLRDFLPRTAPFFFLRVLDKRCPDFSARFPVPFGPPSPPLSLNYKRVAPVLSALLILTRSRQRYQDSLPSFFFLFSFVSIARVVRLLFFLYRSGFCRFFLFFSLSLYFRGLSFYAFAPFIYALFLLLGFFFPVPESKSLFPPDQVFLALNLCYDSQRPQRFFLSLFSERSTVPKPPFSSSIERPPP